MTVNGIVEIGGKRVKVAREVIRKLKVCLDELCITHIVDDVPFYSPCEAALAVEEIDDVGICNGKKEGRVSPESDSHLSGKLEFRELIIPYFYQIDFISLIQLSDEDAEFLGDLLYGSDN
jgi:hypothetical protein